MLEEKYGMFMWELIINGDEALGQNPKSLKYRNKTLATFRSHEAKLLRIYVFSLRVIKAGDFTH